jgi:hypothetical protein
LLTVIVGKVGTERNIFWLLSGTIDNENHDALLPTEEKARLGIFEDVCAGNLCQRPFFYTAALPI